ncbi:MAG: phosphate acyltransferase PlsX [Deltaproteobacteria bacterium]|nr:phosphate acyltransferase PlsX [Deltaproteobacteria bacterium]
MPPPAAISPDSAPVQIALDAMGGDHAPEAVVAGAARLSLSAPRLQLTLVGDVARISAILERTRHDPERLSVQHAAHAISMDENPREALAGKPDASLLVAARMVAAGQADALVTAGNTGAAVLACARSFGLLPGIRRAALAAVYPTQRVRGGQRDPFSLMLDVGATVECTADDLVAFAVMGSAYARVISRNPSPSVALLSNGAEPMKGPRQVVEAHARLRLHPGLNFLGNVEGVDIPKGTADVVVCDGFTGNVALKMLEGVNETVVALARYAYKRKLLWRAGLAMLAGGVKRLKALTDWQQYGGAPILGFDRLVIKAHGRSGERAIVNACKVAAKAAGSGLLGHIAQGIEQARDADAREQGVAG